MKKLIYIIAFIFTLGAFAQGGPKVDVIKFRGEVTTTVRNTFDVPVGETWMIYNVTSGLLEIAGSDDVWESVGDGIQEGANSIPLGISLNQSATNTVQVVPDLNGTPTVRIIGGNSGSEVYQVMSDDNIDWNFGSNSRDYQLNAAGPTIGTDLIDKAYGDANYGGLSQADQTITTNRTIEAPLVNTNTFLTMRGGNTELFKMGTDVSAEAFLQIGDLTVTSDSGTLLAYDNTISGLVATDVKAALDELDADVATLQGDLSQLSTDLGNAESVSTDNGIRIDSVVTVLSGPVSSSFSFDTKTAPATAVLSDAQDGKVIFLDYADEAYTIPSGVFSTGQSIRIQSTGAGTAKIEPGAGVSFSPFDGFQLDSITKSITIARINADTAPEDWFPLGGYIKNSVGCALLANEQHNDINAASVPDCIEVNGTTGWSTFGNATGTETLTSIAETDGTSDFSIKAEIATADGEQFMRYQFAATAGDTFTVDLRAKKGTGTRVRLTKWLNVTGGPSSVDLTTSYADYSYNITTVATGTVELRIHLWENSGSGTVGDSASISQFSIIKTN